MENLYIILIVAAVIIVTPLFIIILTRKNEVFNTLFHGKIKLKSKKENDLNLPNFSIFQIGINKKSTNIKGNDNFNIFEYEYTKQDDNQKYQFLIFSANINSCPDYIIQSNNCSHKIGQIYSYKPLSFDYNQEFSKNYKILTSDEIGTFKFFDENFINFMSMNNFGNIEVENGNFLYYENQGISKEQFLQNAEKILTALKINVKFE